MKVINLVFFSTVCMTTIVGISFLESMIYFLKNKKELNNIDIEKQRVKVKKYKRSSIYSAIILGFLVAFIILYTRPISIYNITDLEGVHKIESLYSRGNISGIDEGELSKEEIEKKFDILDNYNYKRNFNHRDVKGIGEFFSIIDKDGVFRRVEVWKSGYLTMTNGEVYKINSENREDLYKELEEDRNR